MSQSGKILHVYVEVRSVADEEAKDLGEMEKTDSLMLTAPDILHHSQHSVHIGSPGRVSPGEVLHKGGSSTQSLASTKSTSRHSVSFQKHPAAQHRQSLSYDESNQLLSALQTGHAGNTFHLVCASSEHDPFYGRESHLSGRFTAPPTPSGTRKVCSQTRRGEEGKRSIATFSYIEKAQVKSVDCQCSSLCEPQNPFNRAMQDPASFLNPRKRLSDPVWLETVNSCSLKQLSQTMGNSHMGTPNLKRATLDSIAREATHRALEEFGSPQLRKKLAASSADRGYNIRTGEQRLCRSWSGSPIMPCNSRTLPINATLVDHERNRLPRSPATDQLSNHAKQTYFTMSYPSNVQSHEVSNQKPQVHKYRPYVPSCKPTDIQHELPAMTATQPSRNQLHIHTKSDSPRQVHRVNFNLVNSENKEEERANQSSGRRSVSPATSPEMAHTLAEEATKLSILMESRRSPSPTPSLLDTVKSDSPRLGHISREDQVYASFQGSEAQDLSDYSLKTGVHSSLTTSLLPHIRSSSPPAPTKLKRTDAISSSPIRDPRIERAQLAGKESPTLHRHQPSQYTRDIHTSGHEHMQNEMQVLNDSPDNSRRPLTIPNTKSPVNRTSQQMHVKGECSSSDKENFKEVEDHKRTSPAPRGCRMNRFRVSVQHCEMNGDNNANRKQSGTASESSSGVTGSLLENNRHEKDCISSETSNKASQKNLEFGKKGIQSEGEPVLLQPSLHSQKIARAKWEFLFGTHLESQQETRGSSSAPSSGCSSKSPTPIPPSSTPPGPVSAHSKHCQSSTSQKSSSHNVQQIQIELINHTRAASPSLKTGIIRRSVKYSETDIDAVPVRSYRETDLDEVMLAEQEEVDSAFGSNRSVLGTSVTSSVSALEGADDDDLQDEEVVSWASVRMQGDKKRQHASPEGGEVFSRLLQGPPESQPDSHMALKSPISVDSLRRTASDGLDSFSRHFESIMESHRAKGTSYSSLDSEDITPSGPMVFTFDFPTLTPEIQSQICESAKQIIELSFAPLAFSESTTASNPTDPAASQRLTEGDQGGVFKEEKSCSGSCSDKAPRPDSDTDDAIKERPSRPVSASDPEVAERLATNSSETLANGNKADLQAAKRLAKRLYNLDGFRKSDVARHLSKNNDFSHMVAEEYLSYFNFSGMTVDQALRVFLREFALMGETQERERVLSHFSRRYLQCNPNTIPIEDSVHTLTCAVMLLNTDLHGHNIGKRMSCTQFISNLEGLNDGKDFPKDLLKALYNSIKNEKLQWTIDEEELRKSFSELDGRKDSTSHTMKRISSGGNPLVSVAQQSSAQVYKNGFLVRKVHADPDGKKTPRGKRGWKTFYAILKGLILYLQKDEYRPDKQLSDEDLKNAVSIHHSLAMRAADYSKRPNVFYLRTADWRVFLLQASNAEQMQSWITRINTVAAMFSAPPFPAAIGSQKKFSRPLLPGSSTKLSQEEQLKSHETRFRAVSAELQDLRSTPQDRKTKSRDQEEHKQREEYLDFEKTRYGTYAMLLRAKIRTGETDLAAFESHLFDDGGLQRAHSSPTLPQDNSHASSTKESSRRSSSRKRVKRSETGQRHSYREAVKQ
ncbi:uncharacterized protein psda isoform X1 [Paramisgurnus dabryanus]|uniref:uncharacterized protein psda isoform X1 n=1 Tax=Paramisgurnus dabryanus TaxID=90735 RepID=UPI0031F3AFC6